MRLWPISDDSMQCSCTCSLWYIQFGAAVSKEGIEELTSLRNLYSTSIASSIGCNFVNTWLNADMALPDKTKIVSIASYLSEKYWPNSLQIDSIPRKFNTRSIYYTKHQLWTPGVWSLSDLPELSCLIFDLVDLNPIWLSNLIELKVDGLINWNWCSKALKMK